MSKDDMIEIEGVVLGAKGNGMFEVLLEGQEKPMICTLGGKIRKHNIKIIEGARVKVAISPYDMTRGRITYRLK